MTNFNQEAYDRAVGRRELARTDLEELAQQVEDGEIDASTAAGLRTGYEAELAAAEATLAALGKPPAPKKTPPAGKQSGSSPALSPAEQGREDTAGLNRRWLVGAGILIAALVVILISVQNSSEPEQTAAPTFPQSAGCAELEAAMDAHPGNEFRLAVADCYAETGDAMSAISHYQAVLDGDPTDIERASASFGLGFLNLQIGRMPEAADLFKVATENDDQNYDAKYWYGMMLIYELDRYADGVPYLEEVLELPNLDPDTIANIEEALAFEGGGNQGS